MNIIETLHKTFKYNGTMYTLSLHVTAFDTLCICYREMLRKTPTSVRKILCSVCVEPENEPRKIEVTIGYLNSRIGNARTLDDAALMLKEYVEKNFVK